MDHGQGLDILTPNAIGRAPLGSLGIALVGMTTAFDDMTCKLNLCVLVTDLTGV